MKLTEVTLNTVFSLWLVFSKKYSLCYIFFVSIFFLQESDVLIVFHVGMPYKVKIHFTV